MTRILHVLAGLPRHGVETWLMHVLRRIDRERYQMDFLVYASEPCAYDAEAESLGSRIFRGPRLKNPIRFTDNLKRLLQSNLYDAVHTHFHYANAWVLQAAASAGVRNRICHSHNDYSPVDATAGFGRRLYMRWMRNWIRSYCTRGLACSDLAGSSLYGKYWGEDPRFETLEYGLDLSPYGGGRSTSGTLRAELGLPAHAPVLGHVGRFVPQKNHTFLMQIFAEVVKRRPDAFLLLVGDGPLMPDVAAQARSLGVEGQVTFAGSRGDVPKLMLECMDLFLFPSLFEGLGIVMIEAQASGLPAVYSDVVPRDVTLATELLHPCPLTMEASAWAEQVVRVLNAPPALSHQEAWRKVDQSKFGIDRSVEKLRRVYAG